MLFFRGDSRKPEVIKRDGLAPRVQRAGNANTILKSILDDIQSRGSGTAAGLASYLRARTRSEATAAARTIAGASYGDNIYQIEIDPVYMFKFNKSSLGTKVDYNDIKNISEDYILMDAESAVNASVLAFGHKTETYESTFYMKIEPKNIKAYAIRPSGNAEAQWVKMVDVEAAGPRFQGGKVGVGALLARFQKMPG